MLPSFTEVNCASPTQFIKICHVKIEKEFWCLLLNLLIKIVRGRLFTYLWAESVKNKSVLFNWYRARMGAVKNQIFRNFHASASIV